MKKKPIPLLVVAGAALAVWWLFFRKKDSPAAALAEEVQHGKTIPIPDFGTDNIIDAADAIASEHLTLPAFSVAKNASQ